MIKRKILLINPPLVNAISFGTSDGIIGIGYYPPLGLLSLATVLQQNGYPVKILDCEPMNLNHRALREEIEKFGPFLVGVSAYSYTIYDVLMTVNLVKEINPEIFTVIGGLHPTSYPEESVRYENVDFILQGESEFTLFELIKGLIENKPEEELEKIDGIGFIRNNVSHLNKTRPYIKNLDALPILDRDLLPMDLYSCVIGTKPRVASVCSSRGCPFNCTFCYNPNRNYRTSSAEKMIEEVEYLVSKGYEEIFYFDDLFALTSDKVAKFSRLLREKELKISWGFRSRIDPITPELVSEIKQSGCRRIQFGIESGVDKTLQRLKKGISTLQIREVVKLCHDAGIETVGNFIIGCPGETREDILKTLRFSTSIGLTYAQYNILSSIPMTEVYLEGLRRGVYTRDFWKDFAGNPLKNRKRFRLEYWTEYLSEKELNRLSKYAYQKFYLRPEKIWYRIKKMNNYQELKNTIKGGLDILRFLCAKI